MNDNELRNSSENKKVYRATANLNTAIENPQVSMSNATDINIQETDDNSYKLIDNSVNVSLIDVNNDYVSNQNIVDNNHNMNNNQFINNNFKDNIVNDDSIDEKNYQSTSVNNDVSYDNIESLNVNSIVGEKTYKPTLKEKKKQSVSLKVTDELRVTLFIVFILFISILVIPYIYDFFWGLYR